MLYKLITYSLLGAIVFYLALCAMCIGAMLVSRARHRLKHRQKKRQGQHTDNGP